MVWFYCEDGFLWIILEPRGAICASIFFAMSDFNIYYRSVYESLYRVEPCLVLQYIADSDIKTWINPELHEGSTENMASCLLYIVMSMGVCPWIQSNWYQSISTYVAPINGSPPLSWRVDIGIHSISSQIDPILVYGQMRQKNGEASLNLFHKRTWHFRKIYTCHKDKP